MQHSYFNMRKKPETNNQPSEKNTWIRPLLIFAAITFLLYGNSVLNDYCLDDSIVITGNQFTKQGFAGIDDIFSYESFTGFFGKEKQLVSGGRYRPLSIATFAIEYQFWGLKPAISHIINILLYVFTGLLIYLTLRLLLPADLQNKWYRKLPFIIALLYIIHPIHTEVVTNIKGRDEILALLFALMAFWQSLVYSEKKKTKQLIWVFLFSLPALFSKEHAILILAIIPVTLLLFKKASIKHFSYLSVVLLLASVLFLGIRYSVLHELTLTSSTELMNNSFVEANAGQFSATVLFTLWKYLQLLIFPHPLTYDYYPYHIPLYTWNNPIPYLTVAVYLFILVAAVFWIRKQPLITLASLLYTLPLLPVANIFFPIGTFMSERFLYIPSLGFSIIAGYFIWKGISAASPLLKSCTYAFASVIILFFAIKTVTRNPVWKNDFTLFTHDVKISKNSAKGNCAAGGILYDTFKNHPEGPIKNEKIAQAIHYLKRAVSIHPTYVDAWILLGNTYTTFPDSIEKSLYCYEQILKFSPGNSKATMNIEYLANIETNPKRKARLFERVLAHKPSYIVYNKLGVIWGKELNDMDKAVYYLEKAIEIKPSGLEAIKDLGVVYAMRKDFLKSASILERAVKIDSLDAKVWANLGITYRNLNLAEKAQACFEKARKLQNRAE